MSPFCVCLDNESGPVNSAGYRAVSFSYENSNVSTETKDNDTEAGFRPNFPVPENLLHNMVSNLCLKIYFVVLFSDVTHLIDISLFNQCH